MSPSNSGQTAWLVKLCCLVSIAVFTGCGSEADEPTYDGPQTGYWRASLDSPGGPLAFGIEISRDQSGAVIAAIRNGREQIPVESLQWQSPHRLVLEFPHYDSRIDADVDGRDMTGLWRKRAGDNTYTEMKFTARLLGDAPGFGGRDEFAPFLGRWRVHFDSAEDASVGIMHYDADHGFHGTFLTTTGDYRHLDGVVENDELWLSCFDGAHAFLFRMPQPVDGNVQGDFWSRDSWHETWTGTRDNNARLPDAFSETAWDEQVDLADLVFPDLDGRELSLADPQLRGQVTLYHVFGSWCPNCHDAGTYLSELLRRFGDRGLKVVGVAFELTGDHERNATQIREYLRRHKVDYPVVIGGSADKQQASAAFPLLDRIRSYPTTIFVDAGGQVRYVHTGFSGPATGEEYNRLRDQWEEKITRLLDDAG